jgi:predicted amidohydrolase YtcJ
LLFACTSKEKVDLIVHNAVVYTVDSAFTVAQALAIADGKFVAAGSNDEILSRYHANQQYDMQGKAVYPGFIDAHCHFLRYGLGLQHADLTGTQSFREVVERLVAHRKKYPVAAWIVGRGWDQNDWPVKQFPNRDTLDRLFPDTPVLIGRVDGHAALVNGIALQLAGVTAQSRTSGGVVEVKNGRTTGILVDNAIDLVYKAVPARLPRRDRGRASGRPNATASPWASPP